MKTWTLPAALFLSLVACQGSTQRQGVSAPPPASSNITSGAAADAGAELAPAETDAGAPAAANPLVGLRTLAFREGASPPVGVNGAHGATVWAVTLASSAGPSPELSALFQQTQAAHLAASVGDLNCTPAVGESYPSTIPTGDGAQLLTVTFRSEQEARQFAAALTEAPLRIGQVRVMCAD